MIRAPITRRRTIALGAAGIAASVFPHRVRAADIADVRMAATPSDAYAQPFYAKDNGFFDQGAINAQIQLFPNASPAMSALVGGSLDVSGHDMLAVGNAINHGIPITIVAAGSIYSPNAPTTLLCVAKNGAIRSAKDLEGRTAAVPTLGSLSEISLRAWIAMNGADPALVHLIELPPSQMGAALERGTIEAGLIVEPALTAARDKVRILGKPYDAAGNAFPINVWFTMRDFAAKNPDVVRRVVAAFYKASRWANTHQGESLPIVSKYTKIDPVHMQGMTRATYATALDPSKLQPIVDMALKYKAIEKPIDIAAYIAKL